ncbi:LysR family transcriptional regulator, partial [Dickeya undicola]
LAGKTPMMTTYLLRHAGDPPETVARFIERLDALAWADDSSPDSVT